MGIKVSFDDSSFGDALIRLAVEKGTELSREIKNCGRRVAVNLAFETEPRGFDEGAHLAGMESIRGDVRKIYGDAETAYGVLYQSDPARAKLFYFCMTNGQYLRAQILLAQSGTSWRNIDIDPLNPALHNSNRNNRGKAVRRVPAQIVQNKAVLDEFVTEQAAKSGLGAAGWARCATILGSSRGIPGWKKGSHGVPFELGKVNDNTGDLDEPFIEMDNLVPYISNICDDGKQLKAMGREEEILADLLLQAIEAAAKRAGF